MRRLRWAGLLGLSLAASGFAWGQAYTKAAGSNHILLLKDDGTVWGAGPCTEGQIGLPMDDCQFVRRPMNIEVPAKVTGIAVGRLTSYALTADGTVYAWGGDEYGQTGMAGPFVIGKRRADQRLPKRIPGLAGIVQIAAGGNNAAALDSSGAVWFWGAGAEEKARNAPLVAPMRMTGLPPIREVSIGFTHTMALARDGSMYAWGSNSHGQLGDGSLKSSDTPVRAGAAPAAQSVSAGMNYSVAAMADGTVRVWGTNTAATLGNGTKISVFTEPGSKSLVPAAVPGVTNAKAVSAGTGTVAVLLKDGTLRMWGHDGWGNTGIGTFGGYQMKPVKTKLTGVEGVFMAGSRCFAVAGGQLYVWGFGNSRFQRVLSKNLYVPTLFVAP